MQAVYLLTLSAVCTLGCLPGSHYKLIHDGKDLCSDFAHHNSEALEVMLLYYVYKALHGFYLKEGLWQIRFDGNASDWYAKCWPDKIDFRCALLLGHVKFTGYDESKLGLRPLPFGLAVHKTSPEANVTHLMVHLNVQFQQFKTLRVTVIHPLAFQFEGCPPQNPYLKSLKDTLLSGFHEAFNLIDCNSA